ncbi:3-oxo-5-alpha-steroid 4-dehydrogenase-domain-containing protein [Vararia minispora EC-137]|uniref:3-oxo-5-alpha-steroid 4-dehydrogenase-domain-containing protein n=1 Tax=Vararia minispora EC-137 TaxID=1314806 RepID=A0ACB8QRU9_9AGAM|nr:3-oxo-5-alpha-steroid 4-dehydrogenase-domain-containing protein [Vararia minispora EC-137]
MVAVTISAAGKLPLAKGLPATVEVSAQATVGDIKKALQAKFPKFKVSRQKLSRKGDKKSLMNEATLTSAGISDGTELEAKDLGPQIGWTTVFLVEYGGPLLIHPLFYHLPQTFYRQAVEHSPLQKYVYGMVMAHFVKRELETLFVHRFSHDTMPFRNIFKNSAHYHILSGVLLAGAIYSPTYSATSSYIVNTIRDNPRFLQGCTAFWVFCQLSNFSTHMTIRNLRPAGTRRRAIPYGYGFGLVSVPNYFFETLGWTTISVMTGSYAAWFFTFVSTYQMLVWAAKKHQQYKKEFGKEYPRNRKAMIPFIF